MAKGKTAHKSSAAYRSAGKRASKGRRNVQSEITKAEAKIRQLTSRRARGLISQTAFEAKVKKQQAHIQRLKQRLAVGFSVDRGNYASMLSEWQSKQED